MRKHLRPLTTSDVLVALIKQDSLPDRTPDLKHYLYQSNPQLLSQDTEAEELMLVPQFATVERSDRELLEMHFSRGSYSPQSILNYQNLLKIVDAQMQKIINSYGGSFEKSSAVMDELALQVGNFGIGIVQGRRPLGSLLTHLCQHHLSICRKIRLTHNMEKTLGVMRLWNSSNISGVLRIKADSIITQYPNLQQLLNQFDQVQNLLSQRKDEYQNYRDLMSLILARKEAVLKQVYLNAADCVVAYQDNTRLAIILNQYEYASKHLLLSPLSHPQLPLCHQTLFSMEGLPQLVDANLSSIYQTAQQFKVVTSSFVGWYRTLFTCFLDYCSNWHKVTTFHLQQQSPSMESFIQLRTTVLQKMMQKVEHSLKFSNRAHDLPFPQLMTLFGQVARFLEKGEQWMGKCQSQVVQILLDKYHQQTATFLRVKKGEIKRILLDEFAETTFSQQEHLNLIPNSIILHFKLGIRENIKAGIAQLEERWQMLEGGGMLAHPAPNALLQHQLPRLIAGAMDQQMNRCLERLNSHFGLSFFRLMGQYQLRQQYVPTFSLAETVFQHFEHVIIILYKHCLPTYMKQQLEQDTFNDFKKNIKVSAVRTALLRAAVDEETINFLNQLRHLFLDRTSFGALHEFVGTHAVNSEGSSLNGYLNANIYFQDPQRYGQQLRGLSERFLRVANQLYLLADYFETIGGRFAAAQHLPLRLSALKRTIASLVLFYFTAYFQSQLKTFYTQVVPLFQGLKFDIKRLHDFKGSTKDYKQKVSQLYSLLSVSSFSKHTIFHDMLLEKQVQFYFKFLIDLFSRIEKVNDNGRELLKQEAEELARVPKPQIQRSEWESLLLLYIDLSRERSEKALLEKAEKLVLSFPVQWWRSNVLWFYGDCSSKERRNFTHRLASLYLDRLLSLPNI